MNKELPLDERIQKLFESSWVNEFNYLENQLLEARYLLVCLNKKYNQLTNNWNELEKDINNQLMMTRKFDDYNEGFFDATLHYYKKMKEIKEGK